MHMHKHIHIHIYIHIYMYTHVYMYVYIYMIHIYCMSEASMSEHLPRNVCAVRAFDVSAQKLEEREALTRVAWMCCFEAHSLREEMTLKRAHGPYTSVGL